MAPNSTLVPKMLRYMQVSSALGKRAMDQLATQAAAEKRASDLRPQLLQTLLSAGVIGEHQKTAAESLLADHAGTMQLLHNAVAKIAELTVKKAAVNLGEGVDAAKSGSDPVDPEWSLKSAFVGQRTTQKKASDAALMRGLGLEA